MGWMSYRRGGAIGTTRVRITRGRRRVLLALLSGAGNMHGFRLASAAQVPSWALYSFLDHLEAAGWVDKSRRKIGLEARYCYSLTEQGRLYAAAELCLIMPALPLTPKFGR
jgi:DNA-binding PadR family transcriptional regulator